MNNGATAGGSWTSALGYATFDKTLYYDDYHFGNTTETFTATATDAAGNTHSLSTSITVSKVDDVGPSLSGISSNVDSVTLLTSTTNTVTVTFTATITDNDGISSVTFGGLTPSISGGLYTWTKDYAYADFSFGTSEDTLTLTVTDSQGNVSTQTKTITVTKTDDVDPIITSFRDYHLHGLHHK